MRKQTGQAHKMTDKIIENTKRQKLSEIFDAFDSDFDGLISSTKIDLDAV